MKIRQSKTAGELVKKLGVGFFSSEFAESSELRKDAGWRIVALSDTLKSFYSSSVLQQEEAKVMHCME